MFYDAYGFSFHGGVQLACQKEIHFLCLAAMVLRSARFFDTGVRQILGAASSLGASARSVHVVLLCMRMHSPVFALFLGQCVLTYSQVFGLACLRLGLGSGLGEFRTIRKLGNRVASPRVPCTANGCQVAFTAYLVEGHKLWQCLFARRRLRMKGSNTVAYGGTITSPQTFKRNLSHGSIQPLIG